MIMIMAWVLLICSSLSISLTTSPGIIFRTLNLLWYRRRLWLWSASSAVLAREIFFKRVSNSVTYKNSFRFRGYKITKLPISFLSSYQKFLFTVPFVFQYSSWRIFWALFRRGPIPIYRRQYCDFSVQGCIYT